MNNNRISIGQLVADELERQGQSVQWLAERVNTSLQNCYKMLKATSMNTEVLRSLSIALNHNFFADYAALLELPSTPPPTAMEPEPTFCLHDNFINLVEPCLKRAGYKGKVTNGMLTVWIGDPRIQIRHWKDTSTSNYEFVSLLFKIKDKRLKNIYDTGGTVLVNDLSMTTPYFHLTYLYSTHEILASFNCYVYQPMDLLMHLNDSNYYFCDLYEEFQRLIPNILEEFSK